MHDVVIVGAGPGGSAAAYYLARQGLDVLLLDKSDFPRDKTCGDGLTPRALYVLEDMGVLEEVAGFAWRINGLELHAARGEVMRAPIPEKDGYPNHLLIAPRLRLDDTIRRRALAAGASFHGSVRVTGVERENGHVVVRGIQGGKSRAYPGRVVILAVGANLRLLQRLGLLKRTPRMILAARAYYEGMNGLTDRVQAHFENVPLPGYGWVFPLSETSANVGVGFWQSRVPWRKLPASGGVAMNDFLCNGKLRAMMNGAEAVGPVKGFPLRIDFASAPTYSDGVLLVGEAAGLVSPLTGEGIDFALESGKMAAEFLLGAFQRGDLSTRVLAGYDKLLRDRFQRLFLFLGYIRSLYLNPLLMDRAIKAAERFDDLKGMLVNVMMSHQEAADMIKFSTLRKVLLGV